MARHLLIAKFIVFEINQIAVEENRDNFWYYMNLNPRAQ